MFLFHFFYSRDELPNIDVENDVSTLMWKMTTNNIFTGCNIIPSKQTHRRKASSRMRQEPVVCLILWSNLYSSKHLLLHSDPSEKGNLPRWAVVPGWEWYPQLLQCDVCHYSHIKLSVEMKIRRRKSLQLWGTKTQQESPFSLDLQYYALYNLWWWSQCLKTKSECVWIWI